MANYHLEKNIQERYIATDSRGQPLSSHGQPSVRYGHSGVQATSAVYSNVAPGSPQPGQNQHATGLPSFKPRVYANPDDGEGGDDDEETQLKHRATFIRAVDPAYSAIQPQSPSHGGYKGSSQEVYTAQSARGHPPSPGPPPYSAVVSQQNSPPGMEPPSAPKSSSLQYVVTPNVPEPQYYREAIAVSSSPQHAAGYKAQVRVETAGSSSDGPTRSAPAQGRHQRAPSPFQDRQDYDTTVPSYSTAYPEGVSSRIVYTTKAPPQGQGYVQSRPTNRAEPPPQPSAAPNKADWPQPQSPTRSAPGAPGGFNSPLSPKSPSSPTGPAHNPRPYQLKPTLDSLKDDVDQSAGSAGGGGGGPGTAYPKEAEVDALTDLLMKNMQAAGDPDFFGMCAKCGQSIMGENTGCTALDQLFHIGCFTCVSCDACLRGQPFFAMEGKPYCEACYLNTLEKCSVCSNPITDRVLRATGKPYHPSCFTCVVCGKSLDGIPFTVDATSQIHCIEDFHRKFAPRCCVCGHPIMPSTGQENLRIVALDRSFHVSCYKCEDCGVLLSSQSDDDGGCYPLDDHILCRVCNAKRINALTTKMTTEL